MINEEGLYHNVIDGNTWSWSGLIDNEIKEGNSLGKSWNRNPETWKPDDKDNGKALQQTMSLASLISDSVSKEKMYVPTERRIPMQA
jgi:hypothetical protein